MPDLYSNCVILEFAAPITRAQLDTIKKKIEHPQSIDDILLLPRLSAVVCAERDGNAVVPTIAADEC